MRKTNYISSGKKEKAEEGLGAAKTQPVDVPVHRTGSREKARSKKKGTAGGKKKSSIFCRESRRSRRKRPPFLSTRRRRPENKHMLSMGGAKIISRRKRKQQNDTKGTSGMVGNQRGPLAVPQNIVLGREVKDLREKKKKRKIEAGQKVESLVVKRKPIQ